jgi:hypothetical protein
MNRSRYAKGDIARRIKKPICLFKKLFIYINDTIKLYRYYYVWRQFTRICSAAQFLIIIFSLKKVFQLI